jgi:hypothetical protein
LAISSAAFFIRFSRLFLLGWMPWKLQGMMAGEAAGVGKQAE